MTALTVRGDARTGLRRLVADAGTMSARSMRLFSRDLDAMVTAVVLPVLILAMFTFVLGGAMDIGIDYVQYATPGVILLAAGFGSASTALAVERDMSGGMVDRLRSLPMTPWTVLLGHVLASLVKNLVTTALGFGFAVAIGFRSAASPAGWFGAVGLLLLFMHAVAWAATFVGVVVRSPDAAGAFSFVVMFLPYVSSAFVPVGTLPSWLRGFAEHQPVTPVIEAVRGLLAPGGPGSPAGAELESAVWLSVAWCLGIAVVFAVAAGWAFRRRR